MSQFEFLDIFEAGKTVIFCGNAPSVVSEELGEWIDSHDIVVRINKIPENKYSQDVGTKTSILVCNPYSSETEQETLPYIKDMVVICLFSLTRRGDAKSFKSWLNGNKVVFSYIPDIVATDYNDHFESLTTGTYAINLLGRILKPSSVSICGFTMFLDDTSHHYWSKVTPHGVRVHDFINESKLFISLINRFPEKIGLTLSSDIIWVSKKSGIKVIRNYSEKLLRASRWKNENRSFWNIRCRQFW
ncbi:glycosyltransferase family 29 protein [Vibrio cholerae]|uniref:glycosyltransferase family 29 protein n=1 Tax=Vibrio cholerae TaxID=666 RepID=UPI001652A0AD